MSYNAVVVAGGKLQGSLQKETGAWTKGNVRIGEMACLESVVLGLRASPRIDQLLVVCDPKLKAEFEHLPVDGWVCERPRGYENFFAGLHYLPRDRPCLLSVSDMPFAHLGDLESFFEGSAPEAVCNYSVTCREDFLEVFPGSSRRFVPTREGYFTGGGLGLVDPARFLTTERIFRRLFESRKNTLPMALRLGPSFLLGRLLGTLTIPMVEQRLSQVVGVPCRAVPGCDPHFTFDVDGVSDYRYACRWASRTERTD